MLEPKKQFKKVCRAVIQFVAGVYDEDGNLLGEEVQQQQPLYFPWGLSTEELVRQKNRELELTK